MGARTAVASRCLQEFGLRLVSEQMESQEAPAVAVGGMALLSSYSQF